MGGIGPMQVQPEELCMVESRLKQASDTDRDHFTGNRSNKRAG
jgi:hypothetical protein